MRNTRKRDIPAHLSDASTEGIPTGPAIASCSTATTRLCVCPTDCTSTTCTGDCLIGIDAGTTGDPDVPAREEQSTTRGIPAGPAITAQPTLTTRLGVVHASTTSATCTTLRDVVGKRAA